MRKAALFLTLLMLPASLDAQQKHRTPDHRDAEQKMCWTNTYREGLTLAFDQAASGYGDTLLTLQVQPSVQPEYAIIFKQIGEKLELVRTGFREQFWHQIGIGRGVVKTREQCLDDARAAAMETVELPVDPTTLEEFLGAIRRVNLDSHSCISQGGKCLKMVDGTSYVIQMANGRSAQVSETGEDRGVVSENPSLLAWIHAVLRLTKDYKPR